MNRCVLDAKVRPQAGTRAGNKCPRGRGFKRFLGVREDTYSDAGCFSFRHRAIHATTPVEIDRTLSKQVLKQSKSKNAKKPPSDDGGFCFVLFFYVSKTLRTGLRLVGVLHFISERQ